MSQNHVIDPTYFYDAIEEFSFDYELYVVAGKEINELGKQAIKYCKQTITGSLQSEGKRRKNSKTGNTDEVSYNFYCKSLYRINIGDFIKYKNNFLRCTFVQDYDEYGCREAKLTMVSLSAYNDLAAYIKYLEGVKTV